MPWPPPSGRHGPRAVCPCSPPSRRSRAGKGPRLPGYRHLVRGRGHRGRGHPRTAHGRPGPGRVPFAPVGAVTGSDRPGRRAGGGGIRLWFAGVRLPFHRRQVNERWLDRYRPWVYGAGFGWQIGCGLATYITSAAVYLMIVLGALTGTPLIALAVGMGFGGLRGMAVLLTRRLTDPSALLAFHRRFFELGPPPVAGGDGRTGSAALIALCLHTPSAAVVVGIVGWEQSADPGRSPRDDRGGDLTRPSPGRRPGGLVPPAGSPCRLRSWTARSRTARSHGPARSSDRTV